MKFQKVFESTSESIWGRTCALKFLWSRRVIYFIKTKEKCKMQNFQTHLEIDRQLFSKFGMLTGIRVHHDKRALENTQTWRVSIWDTYIVGIAHIRHCPASVY